MSDVELNPDSDILARCPEIHASSTLECEVVEVADAAVIQPDRELPVRQDEIVGIRADTQAAHQRDDGPAVEVIEADLADWSNERRVALPGAGHVEMGARIAGGARLVVHEVVIRAERGEVRIAGLGQRRMDCDQQEDGERKNDSSFHGTSLSRLKCHRR